ncbi:MAG: hypothetical protein M5R36_18965 [Deltaproteobacteria bacterium]|nr:hypothetical protein [Deltaproteobacteria bacterium]
MAKKAADETRRRRLARRGGNDAVHRFERDGGFGQMRVPQTQPSHGGVAEFGAQSRQSAIRGVEIAPGGVVKQEQLDGVGAVGVRGEDDFLHRRGQRIAFQAQAHEIGEQADIQRRFSRPQFVGARRDRPDARRSKEKAHSSFASA